MALKQVPRTAVKACVKRYGTFLMRYPPEERQERMQLLARWQWMQPVVDEVQRELYPPAAIAPTQSLPAFPSPIGGLTYQRYACKQGDPLSCNLCQPTTPEGTPIQTCPGCDFPTLLPDKAELRGQRGGYQIERWLGRQGNGRLYTAIQLGSNQPVVVKEYLLPQPYFNAAASQQQKTAFKNLAGLSLADGRVQDFRLVQALDAIADDLQARCYLILDERGAYPTLSRYFSHGALTHAEVRWVLNQVLQTLEFLHGQKFRLPSGQTQTGIAHGNISLHSLLIGSENEPDVSLQSATLQSNGIQSNGIQSNEIQNNSLQNGSLLDRPLSSSTLPQGHGSSRLLDAAYFIYLCDLALWERLFDPIMLTAPPASPTQDLIDLGYVAFYLLAGRTRTETGQPLDPRNREHWQTADPFLKSFILRLMGIDVPFESAEVARRELARSPQLTIMPLFNDSAIAETTSKPKTPLWLIGLLSLLGIGILAWVIWLLLPKPDPTPDIAVAPQLANLKDVGGIPAGKFTYTAATGGIWGYVLQQPDLIQKGQTLEQRLQAAQPNLQLDYQPVASLEAAIAQVQSGKAAFAVVPLIEPLPDDLKATAIAHDGLVFVVAFSYSNRDNSLPKQLQGKISLEQLQQLYSGKITNWQELGASVLPVNLYQPANPESISVFHQRILKPTADGSSSRQALVKTLPDFELFRTIIRDFESRQIGGIGFSSLSKVVGQCSVYPLAVQTAANTAVQAVVLDDNRAIDPATDLCDKKGSYRPSVELITSGRYPLAYPIAIVSPRRNDRPAIGEKFAEMLKTREGQTLLHQTGLVPLN
ncbi:substrate-binding domain-containing protein [Leptolyngbyaceae cyanobacterium UHCC 1019]